MLIYFQIIDIILISQYSVNIILISYQNSDNETAYRTAMITKATFVILLTYRYLTTNVRNNVLILLQLHLFNGLFSRTTWVRQHQKGNHSRFYWSKRSSGGSGITIRKSFAPYSSLHTDNHARSTSIYSNIKTALCLNQTSNQISTNTTCHVSERELYQSY